MKQKCNWLIMQIKKGRFKSNLNNLRKFIFIS